MVLFGGKTFPWCIVVVVDSRYCRFMELNILIPIAVYDVWYGVVERVKLS